MNGYITQEQIDERFTNWVQQQKHKISLLLKEGFTLEEAIELLKILELSGIAESIRYK